MDKNREDVRCAIETGHRASDLSVEALEELEKCYAEIADKEAIIVIMKTMAKTDVVYVDGHETFFQIASINEQEKTVDLVGFDYDLDDVGFDEITSLFKKYQL